MNWQHFFGVWTASMSIATFSSLYIISVAAGEYRTTAEDTFDRRLWLIPGVLALLAAVFGSVTALIAR